MNTFRWHFWWCLFDIITLTLLSVQWAHHRPLFGWWWFSPLAIGFMIYRTGYHGVRAWSLR